MALFVNFCFADILYGLDEPVSRNISRKNDKQPAAKIAASRKLSRNLCQAGREIVGFYS